VKNILKEILVYILRFKNNIFNEMPEPESVINTREFCLVKKKKFQLIDENVLSVRKPPISIDGEIHWRFDKDMVGSNPIPKFEQETFICELENMFLTGGGFVFSEDGYLLGDVSKELGIPLEKHSLLRKGRLPLSKKIDGTILVLENSSSKNIFHFLLDTLSRLALVPEDCKFDFVYIENVTSFQKQYLSLLKIDNDRIITPSKSEVIFAKKIVLPSLVRNKGFSSIRSSKFLSEIKNILEIKSCEPFRKIYISRGDVRARNLKNELEITDYLETLGFEIITLSNESIRDQARIFHEAKIIIGVHGAGFTNLVYSQPGTNFIEFFPPRYVNVCYWSLSNLMGINYYYLIGEGDCLKLGDLRQFGNDDLSVSLKDFKKILSIIQ